MKKFLLLISLALSFFLKAETYCYGTVLSVKNLTKDEISLIDFIPDDAQAQKLVVYIADKRFKGKHVVYNINLPGAYYNIKVKKGDELLLVVTKDNGKITFNVSDFKRSSTIYIISVIFLILIILIGRLKGLLAITSLGISVFIIFHFMIPLIIKGYSPLLLAVIVSFISTILTIFLITGINTKGIIAILGTLGGVITAGILTVIFGKSGYLFGTSSEMVLTLSQSPDIKVDFQSLLFAGVIIGALGAVMDVAVSISSSATEIKRNNPKISRKKLWRSLMTIGGDVTGTMANTLIFAYVGSSMSLILLLSLQGDISFDKLINLELIATEIFRSLIGSIGILATVPITAFLSTINKR